MDKNWGIGICDIKYGNYEIKYNQTKIDNDWNNNSCKMIVNNIKK